MTDNNFHFPNITILFIERVRLCSGYTSLYQFNPESNPENINTIITQGFNTVAFMCWQWDFSAVFLTNLHWEVEILLWSKCSCINNSIKTNIYCNKKKKLKQYKCIKLLCKVVYILVNTEKPSLKHLRNKQQLTQWWYAYTVSHITQGTVLQYYSCWFYH